MATYLNMQTDMIVELHVEVSQNEHGTMLNMSVLNALADKKISKC